MNFVIACQMLLKRQIKVVKDMKRREAAVAAVVEEVRYFMIWNSFSHLLFQVTKKQVITHRALAHADGPTQVGNDWKLENSELENLFLSSKGRGGRDSRWLINRERRYNNIQVQWELQYYSASSLIMWLKLSAQLINLQLNQSHSLRWHLSGTEALILDTSSPWGTSFFLQYNTHRPR